MNKSAIAICSLVVLASLIAVCYSQVTSNPEVNSDVKNLLNTGEGGINSGSSQSNGESNSQSNAQNGASTGGSGNNGTASEG